MPATMRLTAEPDAPAEARSFVRAVLNKHPRIDDALLSVSELVTNAVRHGPRGDDLLVVIDRRDSAIRVLVQQQAGTVGIDRKSNKKGSGRTGAGGLGLSIVEKVTDAWGVDSETGVWFELRD